jgi:hypothetical protein
MNERMRELAEQVGMLRDKYGLYWNAHVHDNPNDGVDLEKFAELLIQECAYIVENSPWQLRRGYKAIDQANLVKQHFGVE